MKALGMAQACLPSPEVSCPQCAFCTVKPSLLLLVSLNDGVWFPGVPWPHAKQAPDLLALAGGGVDLSQLSIVAGKTCWVLYVDALVLNIDGNVLDALSLAAKAALADTRIPKVCGMVRPTGLAACGCSIGTMCQVGVGWQCCKGPLESEACSSGLGRCARSSVKGGSSHGNAGAAGCHTCRATGTGRPAMQTKAWAEACGVEATGLRN